ncbi:MAG: SdrD B-like domain-containing protein, partial [Methanotrichaceae archaeon]
VLSSLVSDKQSPQIAGTVINWTANATDPDGDQILYKFFLKGPSTKGQSVGETGWTTDNTWAWNTTNADVGSNQIEVWARDGKHANENSFDSNKVATFVITAKPAPVLTPKNVTPTGNVTPPTNVTPSKNVTPPKNVTPQVNVTKPAVSPVENNTPPALRSLTPDKSSPQLSGTSIVWTANATDPDGDQILYRFFLNGPSTSNSWKPETDWAAANTWTWKTSSADVGQNQIRVWVRDGKHANADSFDSEQVAYFTITAPSKNISGVKFNDLNGNGVKDANEPGIADWRITLTKPDGTTVSTLTGADGSYKFEGLPPGSYTISETAQTGWSATAPAGGSQKVTLGDSDITDANFGNKVSAFSISGRKFNDLNGNGVNDGEPGLAGWKIQLAQNGNVINTTTTGADGSYKFEGLANGAYTVSEVLQKGWTQTAPKGGSQSVTVQDKDITGIDFGNKVSATYSISGTKFNDLNGNGAKDANEPGLAGWKIQLAQNGSVVNGTSTSADGSYKFTGLAPGSYTVSEELQSGWAQTEPKSGSYSVNLINKDATGLDFGNKGNVTISSKKFFDINKNGIQDPGEPGIPGLTVHLQQNGKDIATTTTGSDGSYTFNGLLPGTYTVVDPVPSGFVVTTSQTVTVTVTSTTTVISNANFGIIGSNAISGTKFNDLNGNGVRDAGEPGISGWGIVLTGTTWFHYPLPPQTVTTAADGSYTFSGLLPGTYTVSEVSRTGWTETAPSSGSYTVTFNFGAPPSTATGKDFGNRLLTPPGTGSISGVKFNDLNGNGINNGDPGLAGWTIQLKNATNNTLIRTATTDAYGGYTFINLPPGSYVVSEVTKTGWTQTAPSGGSYSILLHSGESKTGTDFGNYNPPPTNPTLTPSPASPRPTGTPITWTATAQDPDGDQLQYRFFIRAPGGALLSDTNYITSNIWVWNTAG